jgi:hypothetical protein
MWLLLIITVTENKKISSAYAAIPVYYEPVIKNIVAKRCGRCHSASTRFLMDYDSLQFAAQSGILKTMIQGPMRRFAGNDTQTILSWIDNGAPEKPNAKQAGFFNNPGGPACQKSINSAPWISMPANQITYKNSIQYILAKDCLQCHSIPFRNLTTYSNVKIYVDNGLLKNLIQPGGPMHRFARQDSKYIIAWINNGAPEQ